MPVVGETFLIDGHLDLGTIADVDGRDVTRPVAEIRAADGARPKAPATLATVSIPALAAGGVGLVFATLWALPASVDLGFGTIAIGGNGPAPYRTPEEAERLALRQLDLYRRWADEGRVRLILSGTDLTAHLALWTSDRVPGLVVLMEGADPIIRPRDVETWARRGLRIVGPAWGRTRYAGGTGAPGGLTSEGRELVAAIDEAGLTLDTSHLAEDAFWEAMALDPGRVIASHSAARALVPGDRQLSDAMIRALGAAGGIVGLPLFDRFLDAEVAAGRPRAVTAAGALRRQAKHVAGLIGWDRVAIGSDLDGGFGRDQTLAEIDTIADLGAIAAAFEPAEAQALLGGNWLRFLRAALPA